MNLLKPVLPGMATSTSAAPNTEANRAAPWRYPFAAGDLRGTGGQDLLVFDVLLDENYTYPATRLEALSGATGATLWTLAMDPPSPAGAASIPDVDGDGGRDVILLTFTVDGSRPDCPLGVMAPPDPTGTFNTDWYCSSVTTYHWTLHVLNGATGAPLWTRTWQGKEGYTTLGFPYATNASVVVAPLVPTQGSAPELVLDWLDAAGEAVPDYSPTTGLITNPVQVHDDMQANLLRFTSTAQLVVGATGAPVTTQVLPRSTAEALLVPGPLLGGGQGSLLWLNFTYPPGAQACANLAEGSTPLTPRTCAGDGASATATLLDASNMVPQWNTSLAPDAAWVGTFGDLDGDGISDLLVFRFPLTDSPSWEAISGATGAHLWSRPIEAFFLIPIGNVDDGPGLDVVTFDTAATSGGTIGLNVTRWDGATGARLLSTTPTARAGCDGTGYALDVAPDALHEGAGIVLVSFIADCNGTHTSTLHAESGRSGRALIQEENQSGSRVLVGNLPAACACAPSAYEYDWEHGSGTLRALDLATQTTLWTRAPSPGSYILPDLTADGAPDLVEVQYDSLAGSTLVALSGATGTPVWTSPP